MALMALALSATAGAQMRPRVPEIGQPAPALHLSKVIGGPAQGQVNWASLRGNVVVIEFWATWCPPCVGSIPHLNALEREFARLPVRFLSITYEKPDAVTKFLAAHPIQGWVGLDEKRETLDAYGVRFLPLTVVVDRDGRIAALTRPMALGKTVLREFLAGGHPKLAEPLGTAPPMAAGSEPEEPVARTVPLFYLDVRPDTSPVGGWAFNRVTGRVTAVGWPAKKLLTRLLEMPVDRIVGGSQLPSGRYTVVADMPAGEANELPKEIEQALGLSWGVRVSQEERKMDVFLLTAPRGIRASLRNLAASGENSGTKKLTTAAWARRLEEILGRPVLDETHLEGSYDFPQKWTAGGAAEVVRTVEGVGLELKRARRKVSVIVVRKR